MTVFVNDHPFYTRPGTLSTCTKLFFTYYARQRTQKSLERGGAPEARKEGRERVVRNRVEVDVVDNPVPCASTGNTPTAHQWITENALPWHSSSSYKHFRPSVSSVQ